MDYLGSFFAGIRYQNQVGHFLHDSAVDLFNARLSVYHDIVEIVRYQGDDFFQIRIDLAVAARAFRASHGNKTESVCLHHGVKNMVFCLPQQFHGRSGISFFHGGHHLPADIVNSGSHFHAQGRGQSHRRVCVYGQKSFVRVFLGQNLDGHCRKRSLAHASLAGEGYDFGLVHIFPFLMPRIQAGCLNFSAFVHYTLVLSDTARLTYFFLLTYKS